MLLSSFVFIIIPGLVIRHKLRKIFTSTCTLLGFFVNPMMSAVYDKGFLNWVGRSWHLYYNFYFLLTLYESWSESGCGSHWNLTSPVASTVLMRRFCTGRGRVVTLPVAGHEATDPDTVFTTTWRRGKYLSSLKNTSRVSSPGMFCPAQGSPWSAPWGGRPAPRTGGSCGGCRWPPGTCR